MKTNIVLTINNLDNNGKIENQTIYKEKGIYKNVDGKEILSFINNDRIFNITKTLSYIELINKLDTSSKIYLSNSLSYAEFNNEYGTIKLDVIYKYNNFNKNHWHIIYEIVNTENIIFDITIDFTNQ